MNSRLTIEGLLKQKGIPEEERSNYGDALDAARSRKDMLNYELFSGQKAARELAGSLQDLGNSLDRLAAELDAHIAVLSDYFGAPEAPGNVTAKAA